MEQELEPNTDLNPPTWGMRLTFQNIQNRLPLVDQIEYEKFKEIRTITVMLGMLGFVYPIRVNKLPNLDTSSAEAKYAVESLDLAYWHKLIYTKLAITNRKPLKPHILLPVQTGILVPDSIEFYTAEGVFDTFKIEKN